MKIRVLKWATVMMEQLCDCTQPSTSDRLNGRITLSVTLPEGYYLRSETVLHVIARTQLQQRPLYEESKVQTLLHACVVNDTCCCYMSKQRLLQWAPPSLSPEGLRADTDRLLPTAGCALRDPTPKLRLQGAQDGSPGPWPGR